MSGAIFLISWTDFENKAGGGEKERERGEGAGENESRVDFY